MMLRSRGHSLLTFSSLSLRKSHFSTSTAFNPSSSSTYSPLSPVHASPAPLPPPLPRQPRTTPPSLYLEPSLLKRAYKWIFYNKGRKRRWKNSPLYFGLPFIVFIMVSHRMLASFIEQRFEGRREDDDIAELREEMLDRFHQSKEEKAIVNKPDHLKGTDQKKYKHAVLNKARKKKPVDDFDFQKEYESMVGSLDLDAWENVRVPRPGEPPQERKPLRKKASKKEEANANENENDKASGGGDKGASGHDDSLLVIKSTS